MHFAFDYYPTFEGVVVAHYEGHAILERAKNDPDDWAIAGIELESLRDIHTTVAIPQHAGIYKEIVSWLCKHKEREIDDEWSSYVKQQHADMEPV